jgi:large subunit ribosomal protein L17
MRHRTNKAILSRTKGPREALLRNLATAVILYEKVKTTKAKAKFVRPIVEKAISMGRTKSVTSRRNLHQMFTLENAIKKILDELGPKYASRKGGYTRITPLGRRVGDAAEIVQIELI